QNIAHVIALDNDEKRLQRVSQNLERLHLNQENVQLVCDDATTFQADTQFDVIVLDAPCTATGVIRRHPDIALLRTEEDVGKTAALQAHILANCWH
ncbi:RsmD family RNA methyltransferase, partial [Mycobacterium tuberculosis]|nr:RsmD family RNA methyltransferase [Mycobacterium tuberculosis]